MRRREFIALLDGAAMLWSLAARAQQSSRMRRIGVLVNLPEDDPQAQVRNAALLQGCRNWAGPSDATCGLTTVGRGQCGQCPKIRGGTGRAHARRHSCPGPLRP
jgi:hypothetical protein